MRLYGQGQNIVQAGGNNGGAINALGGMAGRYIGAKTNHMLRKDLITHQTNERIRGNMVEAAASPLIMAHYYDYANQTFGADHPNVLSGAINPHTNNPYQASDLVRPAFAKHVNEHGIQSGKYGITPGQPSKGVEAVKARADLYEQHPEALRTRSRSDSMNEGITEGKFGNFKDTQAAFKGGHITAEEAAAANPKFNDQYEDYKSKNPGYKGSSEANINAVHSNLDNMGK